MKTTQWDELESLLGRLMDKYDYGSDEYRKIDEVRELALNQEE